MNTLGIDIGGTSIKLALLSQGPPILHNLPAHTPCPTPDQLAPVLADALAQVLAQIPRIDRLGLCLPGLFDHTTRTLAASVNHPNLVGLHLDSFLSSLRRDLPRAQVVPDAYAAAADFAALHSPPGRLLALSLGTGVGACVLDAGIPLKVSPPDAGLSSGHLGQIDVSMAIDTNPPIGPDGGRGSLEAYLGAPALKARFGPDLHDALAAITPDDPAILALVRTLRIAHAIYRPDTIALLGGVGLGLVHLLPEIHARTNADLTRLARPNWRLLPADDTFHAARGAARLAGTTG